MKPCIKCGQATPVAGSYPAAGGRVCRACHHPERFYLLQGGEDPEAVIRALLQRIRQLEAQLREARH